MLLKRQFPPQAQGRCSLGALAPEEPGSVLLRSQGRCSQGAPQGWSSSGARVGAPQEEELGAARAMGAHLLPAPR